MPTDNVVSVVSPYHMEMYNMRKASRLFEIIQILRLARRPVTAQTIADMLEVTARSVYRDIAALQTMRVPIEGERGVGYILRPGFNLPPLMFSIEETEAIVLALAMVDRSGDAELRQAAKKVSDKIAASCPNRCRRHFPPMPCTPGAASPPRPPASTLQRSGGRCAMKSGWTCAIATKAAWKRSGESGRLR